MFFGSSTRLAALLTAAFLGISYALVGASVSSADPAMAGLTPVFLADGDTTQRPPAGPNSKTYYADVWSPRARTGTIHLHGGLFAPVNANDPGTDLGIRIGINMGSHLQIGALTDWTFQSKSLRQATTSDLPGLQPKIVLARVDAHLVPAMLFLQVKLFDKFPIVPYGGVAAGYEWLILDANDYRNGASENLTYANVAWQAHAGAGLRLSPDLRLDGELYYNGGALQRDVVDSTTGVTWHEQVDVNGIGARVGLDIAY
jgi:hypothetical protein